MSSRNSTIPDAPMKILRLPETWLAVAGGILFLVAQHMI